MEFTLEGIDSWYQDLQRNTDEIDLDVLRKLIRTCHCIESRHTKDIKFKLPDKSEMFYSAIKVSEILLTHLKSGFKSIEGQVLCSTAYCSLFIMLSEDYCEISLRNLRNMLMCYSLQQTTNAENKLKFTIMSLENAEDRKMETIITSLISGAFQTNLFNKRSLPETSIIRRLVEDVIQISYKISTQGCLGYSCSTFIHFRNLNFILIKLIEWKMESVIHNDLHHLMCVVFNNWENLISGIKEMNLTIWKNFLHLIGTLEDTDILNNITDCVMNIPWNKAKYFALSEIIPLTKTRVINFVHNYPTCIHGLEYSLTCSSLVSAGSYLYKIILLKLNDYEEWREIFLDLFYKILYASKSYIVQRNLINYWISVTLKKFPILMDVLMKDFMIKIPDYFPMISVMKLGRKSGLIMSDWESNEEIELKEIVNDALENINEDVRSEAFQVLCITQKKDIPSLEEFKKVKDFLIYNINNDSASFRQNILNCFTLFLIRIRDSCLRMLKSNINKMNPEFCDRIEEFFLWIYQFLLANLNDYGNYQRKICSLQIYDIIFRYLCEGYNDKQFIQKGLCRKGNQLKDGWKIVKYLEDRNKWKFNNEEGIRTLIKTISDTTNDVRETAANILIEYYGNNKAFLKLKEELFITGIVYCNSRLFYEAESGCLMMKIIAKLNNNTTTDEDSISKIIEPCSNIPEYLLVKSWEQFNYQENDILLSIYNNQPLQGMVSAIDIYIKNTNLHFEHSFFVSLKVFLVSAINYYIGVLSTKSQSKDAEFPPSFAEMGESIELLICNSKYKNDQKFNCNQHLSNAHQLILNNIWLNLKACCDLSTTILIKHSEKLFNSEIQDFLKISISVLTRCRHKGAIESAGVSLGVAVKHLTAQGNAAYNEIIMKTLKDFLIQSTSDSVHGGSVTRKSAGLTILVHRIVTNDSNSEKPLFYFTMDFFLKVLSKPVKKDCYESRHSNEPTNDFANERDIPLARALHLLCRTVSESLLSNFIVQYAPYLASVCFNHLTSEQWQIRNAALQLYGSLVPKLIGQKKSLYENSSVEAPVSPDELFNHIPSLWNYVLKSLSNACNVDITSNTLLVHSNIVPILSLLGSTAKRNNLKLSFFKTNKSDRDLVDINAIFPYLIILLGSPVYTVRIISAKIIQSYFEVNYFYNHWITRKPSAITENQLHGYLSTIKNYSIHLQSSNKLLFNEIQMNAISTNLNTILKDVENIIVEKNSSFLVKAIHIETLNIMNSLESAKLIKSLESGFELMHSKGRVMNLEIGFHFWLQTNLEVAIMNCSEDDLIKIVKTFNNSDAVLKTNILSSLINRLSLETPKNGEILMCIFKEFIKPIQCHKRLTILKDIYKLLYVITKFNKLVASDEVLSMLCLLINFQDASNYNHGYLLPLICLIVSDKNNIENNVVLIKQLSNICKDLSRPDQFEAEKRLISAISVRHLRKIFDCFFENNIIDMNEAKTNTLLALILLLQDEDCNVRMACSTDIDYDSNTPNSTVTHSSFQLKTILNVNYLLSVFDDSKTCTLSFLECLSRELSVENKRSETDLENPFDHQTSNVYWEPKLIQNNVLHLIKCLRGKNINV